MNVTGIENVMSAGQQTGAADGKTMGRDDFLKLLVEQLKNQDPLDPMESAEFSSQLAQFSSLEQLTNLNEGVEKLISQQSTTTSTQAVNFIGKAVTAAGNTIDMADGQPVDCLFLLEGNAEEAVAYIYDDSGLPVKTIKLGKLAYGDHQFAWDGTNGAGEPVDAGTYTFEVVAMNADGGRVETQTYMAAEITGVKISAGSTILMAGDREIPIESVESIKAVPASAATTASPDSGLKLEDIADLISAATTDTPTTADGTAADTTAETGAASETAATGTESAADSAGETAAESADNPS